MIRCVCVYISGVITKKICFYYHIFLYSHIRWQREDGGWQWICTYYRYIIMTIWVSLSKQKKLREHSKPYDIRCICQMLIIIDILILRYRERLRSIFTIYSQFLYSSIHLICPFTFILSIHLQSSTQCCGDHAERIISQTYILNWAIVRRSSYFRLAIIDNAKTATSNASTSSGFQYRENPPRQSILSRQRRRISMSMFAEVRTDWLWCGNIANSYGVSVSNAYLPSCFKGLFYGWPFRANR